MSCSFLAFLPPLEPAGAGPVRVLSPEEIKRISAEITPVNKIDYDRHKPLTYWREPFVEPPRRRMGGASR